MKKAKQKRKRNMKKEGSVFVVDLDEIPNGHRCPIEFCRQKEEFERQQRKFNPRIFEPCGALQ